MELRWFSGIHRGVKTGRPGRMWFQKNENLRTKIKLEYEIFRWARTTGVITLNCIQSKIAIHTSNHT